MVQKACIICGAHFETRGNGKTCSRECIKVHFRQSNARWRAANRERVRCKGRAWDRANKEKIKEKSRKWRMANLEKARGIRRAWGKANPEKVRENRMRWAVANPEKVKACNAHRKQMKNQRRVQLETNLVTYNMGHV